MVVYLVTEGEYSDRRVCGVFSTPERAEEARVLFNSQREPQEIVVDEIPAYPPGLFPFMVCMSDDGHVEKVVRLSIDDDELQQVPNWQPWGVALPHPGLLSPDRMSAAAYWAWATDKKHAVKIANERRTGLLARGVRPTSWDDHKAESERET